MIYKIDLISRIRLNLEGFENLLGFWSAVLLFVSGSYMAQAQSAYPNSISAMGGKDTLVGGMHFSFTVGQSVANTIVGPDTSKMQMGFQAGYSNAEEIDSSIARFYIGNIPPFDLFHGDPNAFYIISPVSPTTAKLSYKLSRPIAGMVEAFDSTIIVNDTVFGYIRFRIPTTETTQFAITFFGGVSVADTQRVVINPLKNPPMEVINFGVGNTQKYPDLTGRSYLIAIDDSSGATQYMNGLTRPVRDVEVAGVALKIDRTMPLGPANIYARFHSDTEGKNANIRSLSLYADTLYVNDEIRLPGTDVTIYARKIIFNDRAGFPPAAINTTPYSVSLPATTDTLGLPGTDGGDIRLFVKEFISEPKFRFLQAGGMGQNGKPSAGLVVPTRNGDAGNGGNFYSGLDIGHLSDRVGSYSGSGGPQAHVLRGNDGRFIFTGDTIHWMHPHFVKLVHRYADDLFMLGKTDVATRILSYYQLEVLNFQANGMLFPEYGNAAIQIERAQNGLEMMVMQSKINASLSRMESGLDYFGNTPGYAPLLSNEFLLNIYQNQLNSTMDALFLADLVRSANETQISIANRKLAAIARLESGIATETASINALLANSVYLNIKVEENNNRLEGLKNEMIALTAELELRANKIRDDQRKKAKRQKIGKIIQTVGNATAMIPTPWTQGIGTALSIGGGLYADPPQNTNDWIKAGMNATQKIQAAYKNTNYTDGQNAIASNFNTLVQNGFCENQAQMACAVQQFKTAKALIEPFQQSVKDILAIANGNSVGVQQVDEIMAGLRAQEPRFQAILDKTAEIQQENNSFLDNIRSNIAQTEMASNRILSSSLAMDVLSRQGSMAISRVNMQMVQYVNELENDNFFRLKKYQYLLAKSYEFRTCQPYPGDMSVDSAFFQIKAMVTQASCPSATCNLTASQLTTLKNLFYLKAIKPILDALVESVIGGNAPLTTSTFYYYLNPSDLEKLNKDKGFLFNPLEQYPQLFDASQEDYRIASLTVDKIWARRASGLPFASNNDNITLRLDYPAIAKTKRQGKIYYFSNFDVNGKWPIKYGGTVRPAQANAMDDIRWNEDLKWLCGLINYSNTPGPDCENLISRAIAAPPFWADMEASLRINLFNSLPAGDSVVIDSVRFGLSYSYRPALATQKFKVVKLNESWMKPLFEFSQQDVNGKKDGFGELYRTYFTGSNVSIKAQRIYGNYRFAKWVLRYSNGSQSSDTSLSISTLGSLDGTFTAHYVPMKEVIYTRDTVWVGAQSSTETDQDTVLVMGRGTAKTASEYVTDSLVVTAGSLAFAEGINERSGMLDSLQKRYVKLSFDANPGTAPRQLGKVFTFAPEDDKFIHSTLVMQHGITGIRDKQAGAGIQFRVIPNPNNGTFTLQLPDCCPASSFELTDVLGRKVEDGSIFGDTRPEIRLQNPAKGIYLLRVHTQNGVLTNRVVVE